MRTASKTSRRSHAGTLEGGASATKKGLDNRIRDKSGEIDIKHGNTLVGTLRETYETGFAKGYRAEKELEGLDRSEPQKGRWQLQSAKAQFSEVFRRARSEGPQWVTRQDKEAVVMLAAEEYERISALSRQPKSLIEFFARSPLAEVQVDLERQPDYGREVEL
jgi:prevent-host-death family protein